MSGRNLTAIVVGAAAGIFGLRALRGAAEDDPMEREQRKRPPVGTGEAESEFAAAKDPGMIGRWFEEDGDRDPEEERKELEDFKGFLQENPVL